MSTAELTVLPESIAAGTTVEYLRSHSAYPASEGWELTLYLQGADKLSKVGVPEGDRWRVTLAKADTAALALATLRSSSYRWVERVEKDGIVHQAAEGLTEVTPDFEAAGAGTLQAWAEKTLPVVEAALAGQLPASMRSYEIYGIAVTKFTPDELWRLRSRLQTELGGIRNPGAYGRPVKISFTPVD